MRGDRQIAQDFNNLTINAIQATPGEGRIEIRFENIVLGSDQVPALPSRNYVKKFLELDPEAKVIVSSGYSTNSTMSDYKSYGFRGAISKPYSVNRISGG